MAGTGGTGAPAGSGTLVVVPTELERRRLLDRGPLPPGLAQLECCGFGPVAAAARTAELCARLRPAHLVLVGIAGAYDPERHPPGSAIDFGAVAIDGVGVGRGAGFLAPPALGFPQWPGSGGRGARDVPPIHDRLELEPQPGASDRQRPLLLTTCAASADEDEAAERRARFPEAVAEDMEGFAVATAGVLAGARVSIVRGISNRVGDREAGNWRVPAALSAARRLLVELLERGAAAP
jgi:futalosine hydrolase